MSHHDNAYIKHAIKIEWSRNFIEKDFKLIGPDLLMCLASDDIYRIIGLSDTRVTVVRVDYNDFPQQ